MISKTFKKIVVVFVAVAAVTSCAKKLDLNPTNDLTPDKVYSTPAGYKSVLAKIYGGLASGGNQGPAGQPDISGNLDEGSQIAFIRPYFNCEELPTDEAVVAWNDQTIHDYHNLSFTSADPFLKGMYARPMYNITLANEYLRYSTDEAVAANGITGADATSIKSTRAEVRFLRAFNYWLMMDLFGNSTFVTEADVVGGPLPAEIKRADLFKYITGELKAIDADLAPVKTIEYGRVDQGAAWALLARVYLNAEVYTGTPHYDSAIFYASKVIGGGYALQSSYAKLFMADNDKQKNEFIFAVPIDGLHTQGYGNTTFIAHAASGDEATSDYGVTGGGWYGYRATSGLVNLFADKTGASDTRAMFTTSKYGTGSAQLAIADISNFDQGPHVVKFVNKRSDGAKVNDPTGYFADIDFPVFRLPEMYLIYAEATLRGGAGGDKTAALTYLNLLRARAYGGTAAGQLTTGDLTTQLILDERGRELYWEGHRRTDLIRFGLLTSGTYLWPWKGGVASGTAVDAKYNLFPIPATVLSANSNLTQNPGY
ncbi:MAG: RagB/SusD family nutrient uptake outer membrane protein [Ferruginibacter sp.]|uniref:RagB/SusD family nutrient uptake outer membrane protein n=1 Tax=Ferruginibacter sp. TaxID=1940288 RepID=UPI00265B6265|nr:RagB/SusD family nutrient uptake outer membrane protein [Ferruginibacter sp.]MDB5279492.1 RagB/SusD family nutrient uptake outer membrane protein [Ferruginibacter sp.]